MPRRVVESRAASTPFLVGVVRPVLVLPMGWAPDRKVILHELIHLKQRDVAAGWGHRPVPVRPLVQPLPVAHL